MYLSTCGGNLAEVKRQERMLTEIMVEPPAPSKAGRSEHPTLPAARPTNLHEMKVATDALGEEMNLRMNLEDLKVPGFGLRAVPGSLDENTTNTIVNHSRLDEIYLS